MEDSRIGGKKLLVARNDKRSREIHRWVRCLPKKQELAEALVGKLIPNAIPEKP